MIPPLLSATRNLLILGAFVLVVNVALGEAGVPLSPLAISPTPSIGWCWQWATHWLVTGTSGAAVLFKILELVIVSFMGTQYELLAGSRRLYGLLLASVLGGAFGAYATLWLTPYAPWAGSSLTTALVLALALRASGGGGEVEVPVMGRTSPWVFVAGFGVFSLFNAFSERYAPVAGVYAATCGAAYAYERWIRRGRPAGRRSRPSSEPQARQAGRRFRVIEGGAREDDDERPKYLN